MTKVAAQKRELNTKAKKLRREGWIPGIICGKEIEPMPIQIEEKEASRLIRETKKGGQVTLQVGDQKYAVILKDLTYNALKKQIEVIDFQVLVKGEKIHTTAEIICKNEELANGSVNQELSEIHYKATPEHLIDTIVLDFEQLKDVQRMAVSDLEVFKNPDIDITTPASAIIFTLSHGNAADEETDADAAEPEADAAAPAEKPAKA